MGKTFMAASAWRPLLTLILAIAAAALFSVSASHAAATLSIQLTSAVTRGSSAELTVTISGTETNPVTVNYSTQNGTALAGTDYTPVSGSFIFFPGDNPKTMKILVPILANASQSGSSTFTVALTNGTVILPNGAPGTAIDNASATVTIPVIPPSASFSVPAFVLVNKALGTASITVTKAGIATNAITIDYATENGTAISAVDYTPTSGTLRFNFDETTKVISVPILSTAAQSGETRFTVALSHVVSLASVPDAVSISNASTQVRILSNDNSPSLYVSAVPSTTQSGSRSFLRVFNSGDNIATATFTLYDGSTGTLLAKWTSPGIAAGTEQQYDIGTIESGADRSFVKPSSYSIAVQATFPGSIQHVVYRPVENLLTNQSVCSSGTTADARTLIAVHTKNLGGFLSSIVFSNTGTTAAAATIGVYNAVTGGKLGTFTTAAIPAKGQIIQPVDAIETNAPIVPGNSLPHYVVRLEGSFTGFLQHLVLNRTANAITDMTITCTIPAQ